MKKVVIAGGRDFCDYEEARTFIDSVLDTKGKDDYCILSGGCSGADKIGEKYALEHGFKIEYHLAKWSKYKRAAGPVRNREMAEHCDFLICFWNRKSKGTLSMIEEIKKLNKEIYIMYY